jgi:hypothetical protein
MVAASLMERRLSTPCHSRTNGRGKMGKKGGNHPSPTQPSNAYLNKSESPHSFMTYIRLRHRPNDFHYENLNLRKHNVTIFMNTDTPQLTKFTYII